MVESDFPPLDELEPALPGLRPLQCMANFLLEQQIFHNHSDLVFLTWLRNVTRNLKEGASAALCFIVYIPLQEKYGPDMCNVFTSSEVGKC